MAYGHWDISLVGKFNPEEYLGFVYQITHVDSGKGYIGCKHLWKFKRGKKTIESTWKKYLSSSTELNEDIKKFGKGCFSFEIISLTPYLTNVKTAKSNLYYDEQKLQMHLGVVESDNWYNKNIGGRRFWRTRDSYINTSGTNHYRYIGPFRITYKDGRQEMITDMSVAEWCKKNKYHRSSLTKLRTGQYKYHKDIIKMEYLIG
jgi:hypothetical protein